MTDANNANNPTSEPSLSDTKLSPEMAAAVHSALEDEAAKQQSQAEATPAENDSENQANQASSIEAAIEAAKDELDDTLEFPADNAKDDEIAALKDQLMRSMAETENLRKRGERDLADARKYAVTGFAREMVNIAENLQLAIQSIPEADRKQDERLANLAQGVELTYSELLRNFQANGIVRIDPVGEKFNHNHHQAVARIDDADAEPGTVVQVLQAGYIIHDRLLRPAMVTVAKGGDKAQAINTEA